MGTTPAPISAVGTSKTAPGPSSSTDDSGENDARPQLPWAFIDCPQDTLIILITHMLNMLIQHNDQVVLTPDALTRFHSRAPPGISVEEYLKRIVRYTNMETIPLLSLLAYIDITCQNLPTFTLSSLTVHRFLIAGVCVGSKAQCDVFCTNAHYAKVGGIKTNELNALEREFLKVTQWTLACNAELLQRYYTSLIRSHGGYTQATEPQTSPFTTFDPTTNRESTEDVDAEMKSPGHEELNVDMVSEPARSMEAFPVDPSSSSDPNLPGQTDQTRDVTMEGDSSSTPGVTKRRRRKLNETMDIDPSTNADGLLDSPASVASSSIPSSRSSLRKARSSRGRAISMSSYTSPKLAEPQVNRSPATAFSTKTGPSHPEDSAPGHRPNGQDVAATTSRSTSAGPPVPKITQESASPTSTPEPSDHPSHSFKHFVGGIFHRKNSHRPSEERDITPPKAEHHGILSSFRHSKSRSPTPDAPPPSFNQAMRKPTTAILEPPRAPDPQPQPSPGPDTSQVSGSTNRAPPSDTPPDQLPTDLSIPAAPAQVVAQLATPKTRASKRVASAETEDLERMTKSPKIEARSPFIRADVVMASPRLRSKSSVSGTGKPGQRRRAVTGDERNGEIQ